MADINVISRLVKSVLPTCEVIEHIGGASFDHVYKVKSGEKISALKIIRVPDNTDEIVAIGKNDILRERAKASYAATLEALCNTVRVQQLLSSEPNILKVYECVAAPCENRIGSYVFINTELLNNVEVLGEFSALQAIQLGIDVCSALEVCERNFVRHGDIRPANVFVNSEGVYKLGDIGISQVLSSGGTAANESGFAAPEVRSGRGCDIRSDIYSLGVLIYFLLGERKYPFYVKDGKPISKSREMSVELGMLLSTACAEEPSDRYQNATAMKQELVNLYTSMVLGSTSDRSNTAAKTENRSAKPSDEAVIAAAVLAERKLRDIGDKGNSASGKDQIMPDGDAPDATVMFDAVNVSDMPEKNEAVTDGEQVSSAVSAAVSAAADAAIDDIDRSVDSMLKSIFGEDNTAPKASEAPRKAGATEEFSKIIELIPEQPPKSESSAGKDEPEAVPLMIIPPDASPQNRTGTLEEQPGDTTAAFVPINDRLDSGADAPAGDSTAVFDVADESFEAIGVNDADAFDEDFEDEDDEALQDKKNAKSRATTLIVVCIVIAALMLIALGFATYFVIQKLEAKNFNITVAESEGLVPEKIKVVTLPKKTSYYVGETLDTAGLEVEVVYDRFKSVILKAADLDISVETYNSVGKKTVEVRYQGVKTNFEIEVLPISLDKLEVKAPARTQYYVGQEIDLRGFMVRAHYDDGTVKDVTEVCDVNTKVFQNAGEKIAVVVAWGGQTEVFYVSVVAKVADEVSIAKLPDRLEYFVGEWVETAGIRLKVKYNDGSVSEDVNVGFTCSHTGQLDTVGEQDVVLTLDGITVSYKITVLDNIPERIEVDEESIFGELVFAEGEEIKLDGVKLLLKYNNELKEDVITEGYTITPAVAKGVGPLVITVTYEDFSTELTVTVVESEEPAVVPVTVKGISVKENPQKLTYEVGDPIVTDGLKLNVSYSDGTSKVISSGYQLSSNKAGSAGKQEITVTYEGFKTSFYITVLEKQPPKVTELVVETLPYKTEYIYGDDIELDGIVLKASYSDGTEKEIKADDIKSYSPETADSDGTVTVTVTYDGISVDFEVSVEPAVRPVKLVISSMPYTLEYEVGESLDITGLVLAVEYSDGTVASNIREDYWVSSVSLDAPGTVSVTVTYSGLSTTFDIEVVEEKLKVSGAINNTNIEWSLEDGVLTLSGADTMPAFEYGKAPWQDYANDITRIVIGQGIRNISANAFCELNVRDISISSTVKLIAPNAVYMCKELTYVTAYGNSNFTSIDGALYTAGGKELLIYPTGKDTTVFELPSKCEVIGGYRIFAGSKLEQIKLNSVVYKIEPTSFWGADNLASFTVTTYCKFKVKDGVIYSGSGGQLMFYPPAKTDESFELPLCVTDTGDVVKSIGTYAFAYNPYIRSITLTDNINLIEDNAFSGTSLSEINYKGAERSFDNIELGEGNESFSADIVKYS